MTELLAEVQSLRSERIHWQQSELAAQTQLLKARQDAEQWAEKAHQLGNEVRRRKQSEAELRQASIQKDAELSSYFARIRQLEAQLGVSPGEAAATPVRGGGAAGGAAATPMRPPPPTAATPMRPPPSTRGGATTVRAVRKRSREEGAEAGGEEGAADGGGVRGEPPPAAVGEKTECLGGSDAAADGETEEQSARESGKGSHTHPLFSMFCSHMTCHTPMIRVYIYI